jgi:predicted O-linked N-acetylglucosamine transferase (SPINDLY family)
MLRRFAREGIPAERVTLLPGTDHHGLLATYAEVDISLDTWPYCGGNTIAESFWQGVPVVTLLGDRFSARYGASLLHAHGCDDFIASSAEDYIAIAAALAADADKLSALRTGLRKRAAAFGFNDSAAFARKLEDAYNAMESALGRHDA